MVRQWICAPMARQKWFTASSAGSIAEACWAGGWWVLVYLVVGGGYLCTCGVVHKHVHMALHDDGMESTGR